MFILLGRDSITIYDFTEKKKKTEAKNYEKRSKIIKRAQYN